MSSLPKATTRTALLSDCGSYRYRLGRSWDATLPCLLFIMLNPSTADARVDDPTIRRCMSFARDLGFGSMLVGNLFAWRSAKPADLLLAEDPAGPENQFHLEAMANECKSILCAWGNGPLLRKLGNNDGRAFLPPALLSGPLQVLKLSLAGVPAHPLYLKSGMKNSLWQQGKQDFS